MDRAERLRSCLIFVGISRENDYALAQTDLSGDRNDRIVSRCQLRLREEYGATMSRLAVGIVASWRSDSAVRQTGEGALFAFG